MNHPPVKTMSPQEPASPGALGSYHLPSLARLDLLKPLVVALSNGTGGTIRIGVTPAGTVLGLAADLRRYGSPERLRDAVLSALRDSIDPPSVDLDLTFEEQAGHTILCLTVHPGLQIPYAWRDVVYVPAGQTTRPATSAELRSLHARRRHQRGWTRIRRLPFYLTVVFSLAVILVAVAPPALVLANHLATRPHLVARFDSSTWLDQAVVAPNGQWIVFFLALAGRDTDLYLVRPDGTDLHPVTGPPHWDSEACWTPDSQSLVFTRWRPEDGNQLWALDLATGVETQLTRPPGQYNTPAVSPDGQLIACRYQPPDAADGRLILLDRAGQVQHVLVSDGDNRQPAFAPDGRHLYFARREPGQKEDLYVIDVTGTALQRLTTAPSPDIQPTVSPDGRFLLWTAGRYTYWSLAMMDLATGATVGVSAVHDKGASFAPDGRWLAFASRRGDRPGIYTMAFPGWDAFAGWEHTLVFRITRHFYFHVE